MLDRQGTPPAHSNSVQLPGKSSSSLITGVPVFGPTAGKIGIRSELAPSQATSKTPHEIRRLGHSHRKAVGMQRNSVTPVIRNLVRLLLTAAVTTTLTVEADIGGQLKWNVKIHDSRFALGRIALVGDDQTVLAWNSVHWFEVSIAGGMAPMVRQLDDVDSEPFARTLGATYLIHPAGTVYLVGAGSSFPSSAFVIPGNRRLNAAELAVAANGDIVVLNLTEQPFPALQRWRPSGEQVFSTPLPNYGDNRSAGGIYLTADETTIINSPGNRIWSISPTGRIQWTRNENEVVQMPTSNNGVVAIDRFNRWVRLAPDGYPELVVTDVQTGAGLTPIDLPVQRHQLGIEAGAGYGQVNILADGGWVAMAVTAKGLGIFQRFSANGTALWSAPADGLIGIDTYYFLDQRQDGLWLKAIALGSPLVGSSWPKIQGWPDGTRRARPVKAFVSEMTMLHHSSSVGGYLQFGTLPGQTFHVEPCDQAGDPWREIGSGTSTGYGVQFVDPTAMPASSRLYRTRID